MLWLAMVTITGLWATGVATSRTAGGLIHILVVVALVPVGVRLFQITDRDQPSR